MRTEVLRLLRSFSYAWDGVRYLFRHEPNARVHLALSLAAIILAAFLRFSGVEWAILFLIMGMVFATEALNTAIEVLTDLVSPDYHPKAKAAKDVAAAAVTFVAVAAVLIAFFLYLPKLLMLLP